jgi:hypothetical protein
MLLAKRSLNERLGKEAADWASAQLELDSTENTSARLAGILRNENLFELDELFDWCASEQNRFFCFYSRSLSAARIRCRACCGGPLRITRSANVNMAPVAGRMATRNRCPFSSLKSSRAQGGNRSIAA